MRNDKWVRLLASITGLVNQRLLLQCEYLIGENRILRSHIHGRLRLFDPEHSTLAGIAKRLGRKYLTEVACVAKPETIFACIVVLSPTSSTVPNVVSILPAHALMLSSGILSPTWPARTPGGVTFGLQAHWPTSVTTPRIRPSETFSSGTASRPLR